MKFQQQILERELDVGGREGCAIVPTHVLAKKKSVGLAIRRDLPFFRQFWNRFGLLIESDQSVENRSGYAVEIAGGGNGRIQMRGLAANTNDHGSAARVIVGGTACDRNDHPHQREKRHYQSWRGAPATAFGVHHLTAGVTDSLCDEPDQNGMNIPPCAVTGALGETPTLGANKKAVSSNRRFG